MAYTSTREAALQVSTVQYSKVQYSKIQYSTVQYTLRGLHLHQGGSPSGEYLYQSQIRVLWFQGRLFLPPWVPFYGLLRPKTNTKKGKEKDLF